jgi:hypothetical protein
MRAEVIAVTEHRPEALARLDVFVGEWVVQARFPGGQPAPSNAGQESPQVRSRFDDANTISGAWEKSLGGASWEHDFALTYRRAS